jgi:hypothetical protein
MSVATVQTLIDDSSQLAWLFEQQNQILGSFIEKNKKLHNDPSASCPGSGFISDPRNFLE